MKIISVTGAFSSVGKTYVVCSLLKALPGWAALKVTRCFDGKCPRGKNCSVCSSLNSDFVIEKDIEIINQKNTDTGKMMQAGASSVLWVKTKKKKLKEAIDTALNSFVKFPGVIIEGNSFLENHSADLSVMVIGDTLKFKPSALRIKDKIDIYLVHSRNKTDFLADKKFILSDKNYIFLPESKEKNIEQDNNWIKIILKGLSHA